jgi:methylated-DNA-[protein]-cysteine S-methyltransferase
LNQTVHDTKEPMMMVMVYTTVDSLLGELLLVGEEGADGGAVLTSLSFAGQRNALAAPAEAGWRRAPEAFRESARQLAAYFAGERHGCDLPRASSGTAFQQKVWAAVDAIPYGATTTYGKIAAEVGAPQDRIRAVAAAIAANPLLIVRPCHRVIGASGSLTGYAGGIERKHALLTLEGALQPQLGG